MPELSREKGRRKKKSGGGQYAMCETRPVSNIRHVLELSDKRQAQRDKIPAEPCGSGPDVQEQRGVEDLYEDPENTKEEGGGRGGGVDSDKGCLSALLLVNLGLNFRLLLHPPSPLMASVSASVFSLPLPSWLQPSSARVTHYDRKRKKSDDWSDDGTAVDTTDASGTESAPAGQSLVLTPNESHQYRIAGLPLDQELPGGHFPHGPAKDGPPTRENLPRQFLKDLSSLPSPIYPPQSAAHQGSLRLQHLANLTTILHRCLLQGDFIRAGRAWGLILREEFRGHPVDVRHDERWGIGAEILLRRDQQNASANTVDPQHASDKDDRTPLSFTKKGFAEAKEYYEKLILNHPFSRSAPHATSALHFYPAMFGLWVYVTQEESNKAQSDLMLGDDESDNELSEDDYSGDESQESRRRQLTARLRAHEMEQAQQIATRMDSLLASPPYSDSAELLELRGMVSLGIGDLLISSSATRPVNEVVDDPDTMTDDLPGTFEERRAQRLAMEKRQLEVQKARDFFAKAQKRGRGVSYNLEHLHLGEYSPSD